MKISKVLKLSFITATILTFTACGGSSGGETSIPELTKIADINQAKSSFQALSAINSLNGAKNTIRPKTSNTTNKTNSGNCSYGGTISITEDGSTSTIVANHCKNVGHYMNGSLTITTDLDGNEKIVMSNMTIEDVELSFSSSKLTIVENETEHWSTIDGDISITSKCFSGNYNFETIEKLYDAQDDSNNTESGILKLNDVTYTFENPNVTIKLGDEEETIPQSELVKRIEDKVTCSE